MKKLAGAILVMALVTVATLAAITLLLAASIQISLIANPALYAAAMAAEFFAGIAWLLGTVYLATHLAVRIFRRDAPPRL